MSKAKLTLYMDEKTNKLAHRAAKLSGKSISSMVASYFLKKQKTIKQQGISPQVSKWIGILATEKTYQALRDERAEAGLEKYEGTG